MIKIYDQDMQLTAYLENAYNVGYEERLNDLWSASFSLPADDPKNDECLALRFVEIYDGDERIELFRILPNTAKRDSNGESITYECEHVLATLIDDILFQYHSVGNLGTYTTDVINYVLSHQYIKRWQLGTVQFSRQFLYNWENETLLAAINAVPNPLDAVYQWTFDTTSYPWTLNLIQPSEEPEAYIRYGKNMTGIEKEEDPTNLVTRLYGLGSGEGVNQLSFASINGGLPYIQAEPEIIARYGLISSVFIDRRYEYPDTLLARCKTVLREGSEPRITYKVDAAELYQLTNDPVDRFKAGAVVRVIDEDLGIDIMARVVIKGKDNIYGAQGDVQLEIANKVQDITGTTAELRNRQHVAEAYAQGATNMDTRDFADNCDPTHPAILKFYVPEETARINKVMLSYQSEAFRAYSKAIEGGGALSKTTEDGGASLQTTATKPAVLASSTTSDEWTQFAIDVPDAVNSASDHNHGVPNGTKLMVDGGGTVLFYSSGAHSHRLTSDHKHSVTIPAHDHTVELPDHTHEMHLPNHTHGIEYGIYEGPTPGEITISVDGNSVPDADISGTDIDIIPFLGKDENGRVERGVWHEIKITPNELGRIVANVVTQLYVESRGGGDY